MAKRAKVADHAKTIWLITYGSGCPHISPRMLAESGLSPQEVHTVQWRESKYTLIRLCTRIRRNALEAKMTELHATHNIIQSQIIGYDSIAGNNEKCELDQHPGFQRMVELLNKRCQSLISWMHDSSTVYTNKKGMLWQYIETTPDKASAAQMKRILTKWEPLVREFEALKPAHESILTRLGHCEAKLEINEQQLAIMTVELDMERAKSERIRRELNEKKMECIQLRVEASRASI